MVMVVVLLVKVLVIVLEYNFLAQLAKLIV